MRLGQGLLQPVVLWVGGRRRLVNAGVMAVDLLPVRARRRQHQVERRLGRRRRDRRLLLRALVFLPAPSVVVASAVLVASRRAAAAAATAAASRAACCANVLLVVGVGVDVVGVLGEEALLPLPDRRLRRERLGQPRHQPLLWRFDEPLHRQLAPLPVACVPQKRRLRPPLQLADGLVGEAGAQRVEALRALHVEQLHLLTRALLLLEAILGR